MYGSERSIKMGTRANVCVSVCMGSREQRSKGSANGRNSSARCTILHTFRGVDARHAIVRCDPFVLLRYYLIECGAVKRPVSNPLSFRFVSCVCVLHQEPQLDPGYRMEKERVAR